MDKQGCLFDALAALDEPLAAAGEEQGRFSWNSGAAPGEPVDDGRAPHLEAMA